MSKINLSMEGPKSAEQHVWEESEINHFIDTDNPATI